MDSRFARSVTLLTVLPCAISKRDSAQAHSEIEDRLLDHVETFSRKINSDRCRV